MSTPIPNSGRPKYYSVAEAAWLLGVSPSTVSRAIRLGLIPAVRRRSRLVVPDYVVKRLLDESAGGEQA
ncbi:helix-turn-helix domain-containing protein [Actinophytocola sp. KF-1]